MNSDKSYNRYKQYRNNRYRYEQEQITFPITIIIAFAVFYQYWYIFLSIFALIFAFFVYKKLRINKERKSAQSGYVNKRNQRNNGCTNLPGTDNNQKFHTMECLNCGYTHRANGSNIRQRKCPNCQGGKPQLFDQQYSPLRVTFTVANLCGADFQ